MLSYLHLETIRKTNKIYCVLWTSTSQWNSSTNKQILFRCTQNYQLLIFEIRTRLFQQHALWSVFVKGFTLRWRHNEHDIVSNHQPHHCLLSHLFRRRSKKTSKLRVTGLCVRNSPGTGEFPAQMASNAENVSIWWRHHDLQFLIKKSLRMPYPRQ